MNLQASIELNASGTREGADKGWDTRGRKPKVSDKMDKRLAYPGIWDKKSNTISRWKRLTNWRIKVVNKRIKQLTKKGMDKSTAFQQAVNEVRSDKLDNK